MKTEDIILKNEIEEPFLGQILEGMLLKRTYLCFYVSEFGALFVELKSFNYTEEELIGLICNCCFDNSQIVYINRDQYHTISPVSWRCVGTIDLILIDSADIISEYYKKLESYTSLDKKEWQKLDTIMRICPSTNEKIIKLHNFNEES